MQKLNIKILSLVLILLASVFTAYPHIAQAGLLENLHDFDSIPDGAYPFASLLNIDGILYGTTQFGGANNVGTIFSIDLADNTFTNFHDFDGTDVVSPTASLLNIDGILYGTTTGGGAHDEGTIFSIDLADNTFTNLHDFASASDGAYPFASLLNIDGILYGTTNAGGANDYGTIFSIDLADNTFTNLHDFDNPVDGANPFASLINVNGILYGTARSGGANNQGTIFSIDPSDNTFTNLHDFASASDGAYPFASFLNIDGILYGTTQTGGANNQGTIFSFDPADNTFTNLHDFDRTPDGAGPFASLLNIDGILYGTTNAGGANDFGTIFSIDPSDNTFTNLHDFDGTDGLNPTASLINIDGILYGTTTSGGAHDGGIIFSLTNQPPTATDVSITGHTIDQTITGNYTYADAEDDTEGISTYRWLRDDVAIDGATATTYIPTTDDLGKTIKFEVTPVATTGTSPGDAVQSAGVIITPEIIPISSCVEFENINNDLSGNYILTTDLDCGAEGNNIQIGNGGDEFTGTFDGDGHTISNIQITYDNMGLMGLFEIIGENGTVKNLGLLNASVSLEGSGEINGAGTIASINNGTIENSYATGEVSIEHNSNVGGLVGVNGEVTGAITDSHASVNVSSLNDGSNRGGLAGSNSGTISNSYATGNVTGVNYVGGLLGYNEGLVSNSYATGNVTGATNLGGFIGNNDGTIENSYAIGNITGSSVYIGGFVGSNIRNIYNSYSTGSVTGISEVGGFVGLNAGDIYFSYSTGKAEGSVDYIGGFAGVNGSDSIYSSFSTGDVTTVEGSTRVGGFIGWNNSFNYYNSGWYKGISQTNAIGYDTTEGGPIELIAYNANSINTFKDKNSLLYTTIIHKEGILYDHWDFNSIWNTNKSINGGLPYLRFQDEGVVTPPTHGGSSGGGGTYTPPANTTPPTDCLPSYKFSPTTGKPCTNSTTNNPASNCSITHTLRQGNRGDEVKCLQTIFKIKSDGVFGPQTKAKVIALQKAHTLVPDGIVGKKTREAMGMK